MSQEEFGSCCNDLKEAMTTPPNSFFFVMENEVLYLSVGYIKTDEGTGFFDHAIYFCPFCGEKLQDKADITHKAQTR